MLTLNDNVCCKRASSFFGSVNQLVELFGQSAWPDGQRNKNLQMPTCEPVRSAEKQRISTCPFADRVARLSISEYKRRRGVSTFDGMQTVLAAILVHDSTSDELSVLSFGVGTKVLPLMLAASDNYGCRIRDCHAEVGTIQLLSFALRY